MRTAVRWFCIAAVVAGVWGAVQFGTGLTTRADEPGIRVTQFFESWPRSLIRYLAMRNERAVGTRSHPLTYAETLLPALLLVVAWVFSNRGERRLRGRIAAFMALAALGAGLFLSSARGPWIAAFGGLATLALLRPREKSFAVLLGGVVLVSGVAIAASPALRGRVMSIVSPAAGSEGDRLSRSTRLAVWTQAFESFRAHPFSGGGPRSTSLVLPDPHTGADRRWTEVHNIYLQFLDEIGVVGLGLFLWIVVAAWRRALDLEDPWRRAALSVLVSFLITGLTESWTRDKEIAMIFWSMLGCVENRRCSREAA